jgi:hypothetical protein
MIPPLQLKDAKFILIAYGTKACKISQWQEEANQITYDELCQAGQTNYGVVAGTSKLCLIDIDKPDHPQVKAICDMLPKTFSVSTGKGLHLYYKHTEPNEWKQETFSFKDGKEEVLGIRIGSSYVVGPGSRHPNGSDYVVVCDMQIADITNTQLNNILTRLELLEEERGNGTPALPVEPKAKHIIYNKPSVQRDEVDSLIFKYPVEKVLQYFGFDPRSTAHPTHGSGNGENWKHEEGNNTYRCFRCNVSSGPLQLFAMLQNKCEKCADADHFCKGVEFANTKKLFLQAFGEIQSAVYPPMERWSDFVIKPQEHRDNLLNNYFLERSSTVAIVGGTGAGKSVAACQIASHLAIGKPTLGLVGNGILRVLYLQCEDTKQDLAWQWNGVQQYFTKEEKALAEENCVIVRLRGYSGDKFLEVADYYCNEFKPDIVVVNPILKFFDGNPNDNSEVNMFCGALDSLIQRYDCGMIWLCHPAKPNDKNKATEASYSILGAQAWGSHVRSTILLRQSAIEGYFTMTQGKRTAQLGWSHKVLSRSSDPLKPIWTIVEDGKMMEDVMNAEDENAAEKITLPHIPSCKPGISVAELCAFTHRTQSTQSRHLNDLLRAGRIVEERNGRSKRYYRPLPIEINMEPELN